MPAVLGRSHSTGDVNFFSLGPAKALSRQHCVIDYRDNAGGRLITPKSATKDTEEEEHLEYQDGKAFTVVNGTKQENDKENSFPPKGAFVIEALGKNLIMVGNHRLRQGEIAILDSGTPIRMSAYSLYFLLPTDNSSNPPKTMEIPLETKASSPSTKKTLSGGFKRKMPSSTSPQDANKPKAKKPKAAPFAQLQAELDALPIETLLERMNEAVESERWERKHQLIGSTISLHAVKEATAAPEIREQAADGGVARTEIMRWIKESPKYAGWVDQMMSKMEAKSYQNTITKALLKAGNVRTGSGGRYIKWILTGVKLKTEAEGDGGNAKDTSKSEQQQKEDPKESEDKANEEEEGEGEEEEEGVEENDDEGDDGDTGAGDEEGTGAGDDEEEGENVVDDENDDEVKGDEPSENIVVQTNQQFGGKPTSFAGQREEDSDSDDSAGEATNFAGAEPRTATDPPQHSFEQEATDRSEDVGNSDTK